MVALTLPEETRIDFVSLKVKNLVRMAAWYQDVARLDLLRATADTALLGTRLNQQVLVILHQIEGTEPEEPVTGLANFLIQLPQPGALGATYRLAKAQTSVTAVFQNGYSQGFSLTDPEGNGVGFVIDRASEEYQDAHRYDLTDDEFRPLAAENLIKADQENYSKVPSGTMIGRIQFQVADLKTTVEYLTDGLGFQSTPVQSAGKAFMLAGDARHHIGIDLVADPSLKSPSRTNFGLDYVSFALPNRTAMQNIIANLKAAAINEYDYDEEKQYLRITGPNQLTLWFRIS